MYCSTCGTAVIEGLSYCKNCGAKLNGAKEGDADKMSEASYNFLIAAMLAIPIVGIGLIIGLLTVMKRDLGFPNDIIFAVTFLSFLLLVFAEGGILWLLIHRTRKDKKTAKKDNARANEVVIKSLNKAEPRGLSEGASEPVPSVTEHTTRQLEPVLREPKAQ